MTVVRTSHRDSRAVDSGTDSTRRRLPARPPAATIRRFWRKVVTSDTRGGCWIFTGAVSSPDGYGRVNFTVDGHQFTVSAHRFALWVSGVDIRDPDMVAEHRCNEPLCVRTGDNHVIASDRSRNIAYASLTGRLNGPLGGFDTGARTRYQRSLDVRAAVIGGWDEQAYRHAAHRPVNPLEQPTLF